MAKMYKKKTDVTAGIGLRKDGEWSAAKLAEAKKLAGQLHTKRSAAQIQHNEMLAIRYQMEDLAAMDERQLLKPVSLEKLLQAFLEVTGVSFRQFANAIDMNDANLKKYINGQRKFNTELARRFGQFFHMSPLTWMKISLLNDLVQLREEKPDRHYAKYDFRKTIQGHVSGKRSALKLGSATDLKAKEGWWVVREPDQAIGKYRGAGKEDAEKIKTGKQGKARR